MHIYLLSLTLHLMTLTIPYGGNFTLGHMNDFRNDGAAKVTGRAMYADDYRFPGMLHMVPVYADYVAADNLKVDVSQAIASPGCVRVLTAADVPGSCSFGQIRKDYPILASTAVRSWGDVAALVIGETRDSALEAAGKVIVTGTPLQLVLTIDESLDPSSPVVPSQGASNIVAHHQLHRGTPDAMLAESDLVITEEFTTQAVEHAYMEVESAVCVPRHDGVIEVYGSMQHPFSTRRFIAAFMGEPESNFEIYTIPVGGGFGGKDDNAACVCARAALGARLLDRPVKLTYMREWSVRESYKRHPYRMRYAMGFTQEGSITAVSAEIHADSGAYVSVTPWVIWRSLVQCCGPYMVDHINADIYGAATNHVFRGAMRGFGSPQINFAVEQLMDMAACKLEMHPLQLRRMNMLRQDSTTITGQVLDTHIVSIGEVMDRVSEEIGFQEKFNQCSRGTKDAEELYGIGLAVSYRGSSLGAEGMDYCSCIINAQQDGTVLLETGIHENGQGSETAMILILSEQLGLDRKHIRYRRSSTSSIPDGGTTVATRGTLMGGSAVAAAAVKLKELLAEHLADPLHCTAGDVSFRDDRIWGLTEQYSMSWREAMDVLYLKRITPYTIVTYRAPEVSWDESSGQGNAYFTYVYSCQAAEVMVNRASGRIRVTRAVAAHDIGKAVNTTMILGQMYGGIAQGIGMALMEEVTDDAGVVTSLNFNTYKVPRSTDIPDIKGIIVENYDPNSLTGAKGIGEPAIELMAPAIANAVYNATGIRCTKTPIRLRPEDLA